MVATGAFSATTFFVAVMASLLASGGAWAGQPVFKRNPPRDPSAAQANVDAVDDANAGDAVDAGVVAILPPRPAGDVPDGVLSAVEAQLSDAFTTTSFTVVATVDDGACGLSCAYDVGVSTGAAFVVDTVVHRAPRASGPPSPSMTSALAWRSIHNRPPSPMTAR